MSKEIHAWEIEGCFEVRATVPDDRADDVACTIEGLCRGSYAIEVYEDDGFDHYHYDATTGLGGGCFVETEPQPTYAHASSRGNPPPPSLDAFRTFDPFEDADGDCSVCTWKHTGQFATEGCPRHQ